VPEPDAAGIRELERAEIDDTLHANAVGRIGCHAEGRTYVVPIIYAYDGSSVVVASIEGRKIEMMRTNPEVCFEVDEYDGAGSWRSVIADGTYVELDEEESEQALALLARRFAGPGSRARQARPGTRRTVCFRIDLREATGRAVRRSAGEAGPPGP
jgi:uncharacterized protein